MSAADMARAYAEVFDQVLAEFGVPALVVVQFGTYNAAAGAVAQFTSSVACQVAVSGDQAALIRDGAEGRTQVIQVPTAPLDALGAVLSPSCTIQIGKENWRVQVVHRPDPGAAYLCSCSLS